MPYPWPIADADVELEIALDIALDYLEFTGQAFPYSATQQICALAILKSWRAGTRHRIRLANDGINAIEKRHTPLDTTPWSFYPRVS
jgi:hypothetical protein